jgi:ParB-like chromosome segregation protein Spo0J
MEKLSKQIQSAKIETRKTDQLLPYARNARKHEDWQVAQIAASIKEFGFTNPVLIDETGEIVAGHGRVMSALKLGLEEVPCIVLGHLTPTQRKAYVIADNQLALNSTWDVRILGNELDELKIDGFDIDILGFGDEELNAILDGANSVEGTEGLTDPDEVPEVEKPIVSRGEVWVLGEDLVCEECGYVEKL